MRSSKSHAFFALILTLFLSLEDINSAQPLNEKVEDVEIEIFLKEFKESYKALFLYIDGEFYLPVEELFAFYQIKADLLFLQERIEGFFPTENDPYIIDIKEGIFSIGKKKGKISGNDFLLYQNRIYSKIAILNRIFGFRLAIDFNTLALYNKKEDNLPVIKNRQLQKKISRLQEKTSETIKEKDLVIPLKRERLKTGTGGLELSYVNNQDTSKKTYTLYGGAEIFGGDFDMIVSGSSQEHPKNILDIPWKYSYLYPEGRYINEARFGYISSNTILQDSYYGIKISNMLHASTANFTNRKISDYYLPGYTIELYINNSFISSSATDEKGFYSFDIPVNYGSSFVELQFYGPHGERKSESFAFDVRSSFVQKKKILYSLSAGESKEQDKEHIDIDVRYGLREDITIRAGERIIKKTDENNISQEPYASIYLWPKENIVVNIESIKERYDQASLSLLDKKNSLYFTQTNFTDKNMLKSTSNAKLNSSYLLYLPISASYLKKNYEDSYADYYNFNFSYHSDFGLKNTLIVNLNDWNIEEKRTHTEILNLSYALIGFDLPYLLDGGNFLLNLEYAQNDLKTIKSVFNNNFSRTRSYNIEYLDDLLTQKKNLSMGIKKDLSKYFITFECSADTDEQYQVSLGIGTHWGYNDKTGELLRYYENNHNKAGATIVSYHDKNHNSELDENEEVLKDAGIYINGSPKKDDDIIDKNGYFNTLHTIPYKENRIEGKPYVTSAGMYAPVYRDISFYGRPNTFQTIYNPYAKSSNIYGMVFNESDAKQTGIKISLFDLKSEKEINMISDLDGEFYFEGIMPGKYILAVDTPFAEKNSIKVISGAKELTLLGGEEIEDIEIFIDLP